jgi:hypothetical protein
LDLTHSTLPKKNKKKNKNKIKKNKKPKKKPKPNLCSPNEEFRGAKTRLG